MKVTIKIDENGGDMYDLELLLDIRDITVDYLNQQGYKFKSSKDISVKEIVIETEDAKS